jgi:multicomponent Na+:H+ antiporter subunit G
VTLAPAGATISVLFVLLGVLVMSIGVIGIVRMPNVLTKLHAASKSVFLGVCSILAATIETADPAFVARAVLIGLLLILTTPVAAYEIARAAVREEQAGGST